MPFPMMAAALGLGGLSAVGGALGASKARKRQSDNTNAAMSALGAATSYTNQGFNEGLRTQAGAISTAQQGVMNALSALDDGFANEVRRVLEQKAQAAANLDQDLIGRGLYGSTAGVNFQRALSGDAQRAMGDLAAQFSGAKSGTVLQGAGLVSGAQQNLASMQIGRGSALAGIEAQRASVFAGQDVGYNNPFAAAGQLGGFALQAEGLSQQAQQNKDLIAAINGPQGGRAAFLTHR